MSRSLADLVRFACQAEALARKPGNVHPSASFVDLTVSDFLMAADAVAPVFADVAVSSVGSLVYRATVATRSGVVTNANLGICLLLGPLALAARSQGPLVDTIGPVLEHLTVFDADEAYRAIRVANPGGLGEAAEQDVSEAPRVTLLEAMRLAEDRDDIARQYVTGYRDLFEIARPALIRYRDLGPEMAIIGTALTLMSERPDTLIRRKCGSEVARESARRARLALASDWTTGPDSPALQELDHWLRADGHRRNPGTTADLIAATLFVALSEQDLDFETVSRWCQDVIARLPERTRFV